MPRQKRDPDTCPLCGELPEVVSRINGPWLDGKRYDFICFSCASTIKFCECIIHDEEDIEKDEWITYDNEDMVHLFTADELVKEGWDRKEAEKSLTAVKRALRKGGKSISRK